MRSCQPCSTWQARVQSSNCSTQRFERPTTSMSGQSSQSGLSGHMQPFLHHPKNMLTYLIIDDRTRAHVHMCWLEVRTLHVRCELPGCAACLASTKRPLRTPLVSVWTAPRTPCTVRARLKVLYLAALEASAPCPCVTCTPPAVTLMLLTAAATIKIGHKITA